MNLTTFNSKKEEFLKYLHIEKNVSNHTKRAYESDLNQLIVFWSKQSKEAAVELPINLIIERFFVSLYYKKITKNSIARKISSLKSFMRFLKTQGFAVSIKLVRPSIDKKLPTYLSLDEINYLLDILKPEELNTKYPWRDKAIFELLYATGIRCSELVHIAVSDLDIEKKIIRIKGKGNKERLVLFGSKARDCLINYLHCERIAITSGQERFFLNCRNQPLTSRSIQRICQMFQSFLQVKKTITPHKLRHSFATHMLQQGTDLRVVQELLGHTTLASTEKYTHISSQQLSEMCDTLHPFNTINKLPE